MKKETLKNIISYQKSNGEFKEEVINIILNNYFNSHNVSKEGLTELLELISIYDSAINFLSYRSNRYYEFNANDLKKQINAKIH